MDIGTFLLGTIAAGILLFIWSGASQAATPWGIRSVKALGKEELDGLSDSMLHVTPPSGMYGVFDEKIAAFMAVRRGSYYNMGRYFAVELVTQLLVGAFLTAILMLTNSLALEAQIILIGCVSLLAHAAIEMQYWNWWGFTTRYSLGFAVNRTVGLVIAAFIVANWIV
ncbi:hypothetical protein QM565_03395 [Geitlerinema splendidum]|jgi:hypothetical protein|nr:hypothetical protein [Geitlerinema splendidum]